MPLEEILIEIQQVGSSLRVSALDPESGAEVVFQAPASSRKEDLRKLAVNKLNYVLKKAETPMNPSEVKGG